MSIPERNLYLASICDVLRKCWPENRTINIVCHGHSVPAGYFATPMVDSLNAYPHLCQVGLKHRFPFAVINVIVTAIGGENSQSGAARFSNDVLCHRPDVVLIDYALNDRSIGLENAGSAWRSMIREGIKAGCKVILFTPTSDLTQAANYSGTDRDNLTAHASQICRLAEEHNVGLVDSLTAFQDYAKAYDLSDLLSLGNHPNRLGHELVARELLRWFPAS
ncbi:MAG: SGNH/GDSL hydrolase family protein [Verrucomicrobiota bacterium]